MTYLPLSQGYVAIVDDEDFDYLVQYSWYAKKASGRKGSQYYAQNWKLGKMHRFIMKCPKGMQVDHINHNPMDNRKSNLRICTLKENLYNRRRKPHPKTNSRYLGVFPSGKKWVASIGVNYKKIHIGTFTTADDAAKAYDREARKHFGQYANLNFKNVDLYAGNI